MTSRSAKKSTKSTKKPSVTKKIPTKRDPSASAVLKKVTVVADSTKALSKEIKSMSKIFAENQKILVSMKNMIDALTSAMERIQKQSRQINILESDTQKLFSGLNQVSAQSNLVTKINDQTTRLQEQIRKIGEVQKVSPQTGNLSKKVSESMNSIKNNSQMIIKIAQRIDEVRDDLRKASAKRETSSSVSEELDDIKKKIDTISGNAEQIESLGVVIEGLKEQFQTVSTGTDDFSSFKEAVFTKTNTIDQKISSLSETIQRYDASASEFHRKTDKVFQELQGIKELSTKTSSDSSKEIMALLKLSEYQSNVRMNSESKYGELKDLEKIASQTSEIINLFDKLSIESQEKIPLPHEVRQWAISKILDCADKWEIRFSDVFNLLTTNLGRDLLKESIRIPQVRDIFGIRAVDEIRKELNIS